MGCIKDVLEILDALDAWVILGVNYMLLHAITLDVTTDNVIIHFVTCYCIT